ncbi:nucleotidyltransferase domain-containing protein, partial [Flavobacterium psychrophilum]
NEVIIYGSRAKGNYKEGSDIDITLLGEISKEDFSKLWHNLDDSYIPYKFDISIYNNLKSESLIEHIKRVGKTLYKRKY